jgi:phosphocarrier protein
MIEREVTVPNKAGLHTRPASMLVRTAAEFEADFYIQKGKYEINGKSIIGVMTLAAEQGTPLSLVFDGADEEEAAETVVSLFENGFGEAS